MKFKIMDPVFVVIFPVAGLSFLLTIIVKIMPGAFGGLCF
jgi:hypothetical protein